MSQTYHMDSQDLSLMSYVRIQSCCHKDICCVPMKYVVLRALTSLSPALDHIFDFTLKLSGSQRPFSKTKGVQENKEEHDYRIVPTNFVAISYYVSCFHLYNYFIFLNKKAVHFVQNDHFPCKLLHKDSNGLLIHQACKLASFEFLWSLGNILVYVMMQPLTKCLSLQVQTLYFTV